MTPDEQKMLSDLANKIAQTPAPPRDPEAEEFIRTHIGNRPDALYLMTQTVLIQNLALQNAQRQIQELQSSSQTQVAPGSSFLGGAAGGYQQQAGARPQYAAPTPQAAMPPQYAPPAPASAGGGAPSFLRSAAQTATGVAGGVLAAEAISSLFHPGGGLFGGGSGFMGGGGGVMPTEEVVNNYYEAPPQDYRADDRGDHFDQNVDDQTQYDDNSQFDDAMDTEDDGGFDDNSGGFDV
ncbi:MAG: DUF2076 domain-containing protein [Acidobacteriaceae bacterium]|nr:DUF2076 domain-containing protein [Acidobacteriaceae bacterium]